jgi:hypothetical protein
MEQNVLATLKYTWIIKIPNFQNIHSNLALAKTYVQTGLAFDPFADVAFHAGHELVPMISFVGKRLTFSVFSSFSCLPPP